MQKMLPCSRRVLRFRTPKDPTTPHFLFPFYEEEATSEATTWGWPMPGTTGAAFRCRPRGSRCLDRCAAVVAHSSAPPLPPPGHPIRSERRVLAKPARFSPIPPPSPAMHAVRDRARACVLSAAPLLFSRQLCRVDHSPLCPCCSLRGPLPSLPPRRGAAGLA